MPKEPSRRRRWVRWIKKHRVGLLSAALVSVLLVAFLGVLSLSRPRVSGDSLRFDTFVRLANQGRIKNAHILDEDAYVVGTYVTSDTRNPNEAEISGLEAGTTDEGRTARYNAPLIRGTQGHLLQLLVGNSIPTTIDQQPTKRMAATAAMVLPGMMIVVLMGYLILSYRRGSGLFGVRSGAKRVGAGERLVTFADVAGQEAAVAELREITDFLADPDRFAAVGALVPKGILLYGPPGCGKTLLARALAGEAGASFYSISGSDFVELYVGVGAARVRNLFKEARENAPALIFIDELDSIGRARGGSAAIAHGEQEQALNQILAEMDGFSAAEGVIVLAATNRPDILDPALLRPGRFDRSVGLERPDEDARLAILTLHAKTKSLDADVDLASVAHRSIGMTGADLASVINEAALLAARASRQVISQGDLDTALQRILEAPERQRRLSMRDRSIGRRAGSQNRVTFSDLAGVEDAVAELDEVREYLANPERFAAMGARVPRGILLSGPPGCGKTLLARALAGEANAAFTSVAASEFVEVFAGEGASRVRDLFAEARSVAPAIVFIDEIDAVGASRGVSVDGNREQEQTLNQILVELDGFQPNAAVVVIAATNRPDILDTALVRPGRFDRHVSIAPPDRSGRRAILALHGGDKPLGPDVDLDAVAGLTQGFSGADLANVMNEAALLATRRGMPAITMALLDEAVERAMLGVASRGVVLSEEERRVVAHHEAGHALVALRLPDAVPPHKLTIIPRGGSLGHCTVVDSQDRAMRSRPMLMAQMATLLAGRAAEELVFDQAVSGSGGDLDRANQIARQMVCELGMSTTVGALTFTGSNGRGASAPNLSERALQTIEDETARLIDEAHSLATRVLRSCRPALDSIVTALLERETLSATELRHLAAVASVTKASRRSAVPTPP